MSSILNNLCSTTFYWENGKMVFLALHENFLFLRKIFSTNDELGGVTNIWIYVRLVRAFMLEYTHEKQFTVIFLWQFLLKFFKLIFNSFSRIKKKFFWTKFYEIESSKISIFRKIWQKSKVQKKISQFSPSQHFTPTIRISTLLDFFFFKFSTLKFACEKIIYVHYHFIVS